MQALEEYLDRPDRDRLHAVLEHREQIASTLRQCVAGQPWRVRRQVLSLARRFGRSIDGQQVLTDSDMLTICVPLMAAASRGEVHEVRIEAAAQNLIASVDARTRRAGMLVAGLAYPTTMFLASVCLMVAAAVFLIPTFAVMFAEFGLRLPWATRVLLDISEIVERFWVAGAIGLVGLSVALLWLLVWTPEVIGRALASRRACWASWSWHTAMLIKAGVAKAHAVSIAGLAAGRSSIQQQTDQWAARLSQSTQVGAGELRQDGESQRLLISALHLEDAQDCADVLTQVTYTNLNLEQGKHLWWLSLLSPLSVCFVGTLIGFMVAALFLPLVSLISGLT